VLSIAGTTDRVTLEYSMTNGDNRVERVRFADGTVWTHAELVTRSVSVNGGNDTFWGTYDTEIIDGGAGNDVINARGGNDTIIGGTGNDVLTGAGGDDTYIFNVGDGHDIVQDYVGDGGRGGLDRVIFGAGIQPGDVSLGKANGGADYILYVNGGASTVTLRGAAAWGSDYWIEEVRFADGTVWARTSFEGRVVGGTNGNDVMFGTAGGDNLRSFDGDDRVDGRGGNDTLRGDGGNDILNGDGLEPVGANLLVNGGFEQSGTVTNTASWGKTNASLPGWTKTNSQGFEQVNSGHAGVVASDGSYWLDLDSAGGAGSNMDISQTVSGLAAGQLLILQFDHANHTSAASGSFEVYWNGVLVAAISETGTAMRTKWFEVVAVDGNNVLTFKGTGTADNAGASLDNVRLFATAQSAGADTLEGGAGADRLTGGGGADIFFYRAASESTGAMFDTITDFNFGEDRIDLPVAVSAIAPAIAAGSLSLASFDLDLTAILGPDALPAGHAVFVQPDAGDLVGKAFLIVDANGAAGYQPGGDYVIAIGTELPALATTEIFI
jgi:Ca2+-binding RTX toxin-like protein